jgi:hypothetical protein
VSAHVKMSSVARAPRAQLLPPLRGRRWGTVVHLGGGPGAVAIPARRLVLLDGDPAACARLRAAARGRTGVEVHERVVGPGAGPVTWHVHNWPAANGLRDLTPALSVVYPRLQLLARRESEAQTLPEVLDGLELGPQSGEADALVVDLPSGAEQLVRGLSAPWALRFDWIFTGGLPDEDPGPMPSYLQLQAWPDSVEPRRWRVWRVDRLAHRAQAELDSSRAELEGTRLRLDEAHAQVADLTQRLAEGERREREQDAVLAEQAGSLLAKQEQLAAQATEIERLNVQLRAVTLAESKLDLITQLLLSERLK